MLKQQTAIKKYQISQFHTTFTKTTDFHLYNRDKIVHLNSRSNNEIALNGSPLKLRNLDQSLTWYWNPRPWAIQLKLKHPFYPFNHYQQTETEKRFKAFDLERKSSLFFFQINLHYARFCVESSNSLKAKKNPQRLFLFIWNWEDKRDLLSLMWCFKKKKMLSLCLSFSMFMSNHSTCRLFPSIRYMVVVIVQWSSWKKSPENFKLLVCWQHNFLI